MKEVLGDRPAERYDVTVAYRIYPRVSKMPPIFGDDKLKLTEVCLRSFRESIGSLRIKLIVLLDACPPDYAELVRRYFPEDTLTLMTLPGVGNRGTFLRQLSVLLDQDYSDLVYFAEDDYFYLPNQFASMVRYMRAHPEVHFATPYDHLDYYTLSVHQHSKQTQTFEEREWRTVASTCLTFLTSKSVLRQTSGVFGTYRMARNTDFGLWFSLTKMRIRDPRTLGRALIGQPFWLLVVAISWFYNWRQVLFGARWALWAPVPTVATHMDSRFLPPGIDWPGIFSAEAESIS